jgi:hypothetical protein
MCLNTCNSLEDACDECMERFYQRWKASNHRYAARLRRQTKGRSTQMMRLKSTIIRSKPFIDSSPYSEEHTP